MWGNIVMDLSYQSNYWFSFPGSNSDVILGLTLWQYWWWFWFTFYITLYYFLFSQLIRQRLLKFSPRMTTSQKAHGKWGDFIICFVPIAWCVNILSNSNFILRMLEWQTESSLLTIRIRGRQWYWVYKIELADLLRAKDVALGIGVENWEANAQKSSSVQRAELNNFQLRQLNKEYLKAYKQSVVSSSASLHGYVSASVTATPTVLEQRTSLSTQKAPLSATTASANRVLSASTWTRLSDMSADVRTPVVSGSRASRLMHNAANANIRNKRFAFFTQTCGVKVIRVDQNTALTWSVSNVMVREKPLADNMYFVLKQKRFAPQIRKVASIANGNLVAQLKLHNAGAMRLVTESHQTDRWLSKRLRARTGSGDLTTNRRLLRTRRTLVIPTNTNLTLITNSFDVVHSWYIPDWVLSWIVFLGALHTIR